MSSNTFSGTSVKVWKKASSPRPVRTWPPSRRITKRLDSTPSTVTKTAKKNTKSSTDFPYFRLALHSIVE